MSDNFDPYFKWLGIPPNEQPPNHYRLLGAPVFVADADVISNAADQRMALLKSFQGGEHADFSQKLLNEISVARGCLLDAGTKATYDAKLTEQIWSGVGKPFPVGKSPAIPVSLETPPITHTGGDRRLGKTVPDPLLPEPIDPYFKWLGIPPNEQPPNHYRLLDMPVFMADADAIVNAAYRRMAQLRGFQTGGQSAVSQKILNEVSTARACLLDVDKKAAYDRKLAERIWSGVGKPFPVGKVVAVPPTPPFSEPVQPVIREAAQITVSRWTAQSRSAEEPAGASPSSKAPSSIDASPEPDGSAWEFPRSAKISLRKSTRQRGSSKQNRLHSKVNVIGHFVAPIVGLSLGAVIFFYFLGFFSDRPPAQVREEAGKNEPQKVPAVSPTPASTTPVVRTTADDTRTNIAHQSQTQNPAIWNGLSTEVPENHASLNNGPERPIQPALQLRTFPTPSAEQADTNNGTDVPPNQDEPSDKTSGTPANGAEGDVARLSLEAKVRALKQLADKATEATAFRSIAERGVLLVRQAISEKRKDIAQRCANVSLTAARRCSCQELLRQITLLILEVQQMPST